MSQGSHAHTAVRLADGKVLVVGGYLRSTTQTVGGAYPISATLSRAEIYDPVTAAWSVTGALSSSRSFNSLTLLSDGTVVAIGGQTDATSNATAVNIIERYTPATAQWSIAGSLPEARSAHSMTLLSSGSLVLLGGRSTTVQRASNCWRINPATFSVSNCAAMSAARAEHAATRLSSGKVYVAGGSSRGTAYEAIYDPAGDTWVDTPVAEKAMIVKRFQIERNANSVLSFVADDYVGYTNGEPDPVFRAGVTRHFLDQQLSVDFAGIGVGAPTLTQLNDGRVLAVGGYDSYSGYCTLGCFFYPSPSAKSYVIDRASISFEIGGLMPYAPEVGERYHLSVARTSATSAIAPTGSITVSDGSASCTAPVSGSGCVLTTQIAGPKQYTVTYPGDTEYNPTQLIVSRPVGDRLRVERIGTPVGTLSYSPNLFDSVGVAVGCGVSFGFPFISSCDAEFRNRSSVTITPTPNVAAGGAFVGWQGACAGTASTCDVVKPASGSVVVRAVFASTTSLPLKLDIDANGVVDATTDGQLIRRFLNRIHDGALTQTALGANPQRTSPDEIEDRLNSMTPLLDVDQNGRADAMTDGLVILRFLLGFRNDALTQNAIGVGARRTDPAEIAAHLQSMMP
jgi:Kelch motif